MPKVEKTIQGDVDNIAAKLKVGIDCFGKMVSLREQMETEFDSKKCILQVYEKKALEPGAPHYSLSVVLLDTGDGIRLMAATSGGSNEYFHNPYPDVEGELTSVLGTILNVLDDIIM